MADALENVLDSPPTMNVEAGPAIRVEDFEALVSVHQGRIYRVLLGQLRDADAAATLTQECFLRAYQNRDTFRGDASVSTWLIRIALNLAKDHTKNRRQSFWKRLFSGPEDEWETVTTTMAAPHPSAERYLLAKEALDQVMQAVDMLTPHQRAVFTMRFVEDMTIEEIAEVTGRSTGTIKAHLSHAVWAVRKMVKEGHRQ